MTGESIFVAILIGGVILFLWTGFAQNVLPWGVKSVRQHHDQDELGDVLARSAQSGMVFVKDQVAALLAIKPESYYSMRRYFILELMTQFGVSAVITAILTLTAELPDIERLAVIGLVGAAGIASIDLQYWNWWGFTTRYTLGVAVNRLVGYLLTALILLTWVVS